MGKDSTSNVLYALGAIACLVLALIFAYNLAGEFLALPPVDLLNWGIILGIMLLAIALIGIYRDTGSKIPFIPLILLLILQILAILIQLDLLFPVLLAFLDMGTAIMLVTWLFRIFYLFAYLLIGYSIWMTRDKVGIMATLAGIIFMIWGFLHVILQYLADGGAVLIWLELWMAGITIVYLLGFIYFIMAIRS